MKMKKKILALALSFCMVLSLMPATAFAAEDGTFNVGNLTYTILTEPDGSNPGTVSLTGGGSAGSDVTIPETVTDGDVTYTVTTIGSDAFQGCTSLTSIDIPNSVTTIGSDAFNGCKSLTKINIPDGVTIINSGVFNGCTSLTSIDIPDGVTTIGNGAFYGCTSLEKIDIPDGVTIINSAVFQGCTRLTIINIPNGVTTIAVGAFSGCTSLTSIDIPVSVTEIGNNAFGGCEKLENVNYDGTETKWDNDVKRNTDLFPENVTMNFTDYDIAVSADPAAGGTVSGGEGYNNDETVKVTATANSGYRFVKWTENSNEVSTEASYTFEATKDRILVAVFEEDTYAISASPAALDFGSAEVGYQPLAAQDVTVTNTGNRQVSVYLPTSAEYDVVAGTGFVNGTAVLAPNDVATFTVKPKDSLAAGTHNETIIITDSNGASAAVSATFTVTAPAPGPGASEKPAAPEEPAVPEEPIKPEDVVSKVETESLDEVPEALKDLFGSVEELKDALMSRILTTPGYSKENTIFYDVKLQFSLDDGRTWIDATEANFPKEGITVKFDYPEGTGGDTHDFKISHMFTVTSERLKTTAGDTEQPEVTELEDGIQATFRGLSPVSISWKETVSDVAESHMSLKLSQKGKSLKISWSRVSGADGYEVYAQYCSRAFTKKPAKTIKKASVTSVKLTKLNGRKLDTRKNIKVHVKAYKLEDGRKQYIGKTITGHVTGRDNRSYTSARKITVEKAGYILKAGKTAKIRASTVKLDKSRKLLKDSHVKRYRYASSDNSVATVSGTGKITARKAGKCSIYIYAQNGLEKKITVTVE